MSRHMDKTVNDKFLKWLHKKYGKCSKVTATRWNGMMFEFGIRETRLNMIDYIDGMLSEFPIEFHKNEKAVNSTVADMFGKDNSKKLKKEKRGIFHKMVAKAMYAC